MTAHLVVQPEAESDLDETFRWYEAKRPGLGHEFVVEVNRVFSEIAEDPLRPKRRRRGTRRWFLRRFPYIVLYLPRDNEAFVLAVFHERRSPRLFFERQRQFD